MTVSQISVFAQSKPGHLARVLGVFEAAGANVRGFSVADTGEFGITRFILDRPDIASAALKDAGFACVETQVLCLKLDDEPGGLARVMGILAETTYIIIATDDIAATKGALEAQGFALVRQDDIARASAARLGSEG